MIHAFMLMVVMGTGEFRKVEPNSMYFRSLTTCLWYAEKIPKRYGNYAWDSYVDPRDRVTTYCKPVKIKDGEHIYDH
tara:strand:- start:216 stop:446 length:231 start_codon:yes stop_codon:yes gene_type:complete